MGRGLFELSLSKLDPGFRYASSGLRLLEIMQTILESVYATLLFVDNDARHLIILLH